MDPITIKSFKGLDNRNDFAGMSYLSTADNIMLDDAGKPFRRYGYRQVITGACSSLWSNGSRCFYSRGGTLYELLADYSSVPITSVIPPVVFTTAGTLILCSDANSTFAIDAGGNVVTWGVPVPTGYTVSATGGMLVTLTHTDSTGNEGGATAPFSAAPAGTLTLTASAFATNVYTTPVGGSVPVFVGSAIAGSTSFVLTQSLDSTVYCVTEGVSPPPMGASIIEYHKGRVYMALADSILYSDALAYDRFRLDESFLGMETNVTMLASVGTGLFISDEHAVYFYNGETLVLAINEPAVFGTSSMADGADIDVSGEVVIFTSPNGMCIGTRDGSVKCVTRDHVSWYNGRRGSAAVARVNGTVQYVSSIRGAPADQMDSVARNNGIREVR